MGVWDIFCLVCGGPPSTGFLWTCPGLLKAMGKEDTSELEWLSQYVGIPADDVPVEDLAYNDIGAYETPKGGRFHPNPSYNDYLDDGFLEEGDLHGLTCHKACYLLLHERLGYKLSFEDVWPILEGGDGRGYATECLQNDYGGIKKYHDQVSRVYLGVVTVYSQVYP